MENSNLAKSYYIKKKERRRERKKERAAVAYDVLSQSYFEDVEEIEMCHFCIFGNAF